MVVLTLNFLLCRFNVNMYYYFVVAIVPAKVISTASSTAVEVQNSKPKSPGPLIGKEKFSGNTFNMFYS